MNYFTAALDLLYQLVWGPPLLILLVVTGLVFSIVLRGLQFRYLAYGLRLLLGWENQGEGEGDISHFQSLMTALAASIGIGNIAGVAVAMTVGGVGALFWMWVIAFLGMATKFAEAILAVKYRSQDDQGRMCGGPMHFIERGLGWKRLGTCFALFGAVAAFGGGNMLQSNSVADVAGSLFGFPPFATGILLALFTGLTLLGGIRTIGKVASFLVPFMAFIYLSGGLWIIAISWQSVPAALSTIVTAAFTGQAAVGGFVGSSALIAFQIGVSRGLMTSEAGLGTASIAAAAAKTDHPGRQAMVSMTGGFLATVVLCTITGLVLVVTGSIGAVDETGALITGASLTMHAFSSSVSWGGYLVVFGIFFFGFTTILGWAYYGEQCIEYLLGENAIFPYRIFFTLFVFLGAVLHLEIVWQISDICNGLMAFPNSIALIALSGQVLRETNQFLHLVAQE